MKKYRDIFAVLDEVHYDFKEEYENIELFVYSLLAFAIPFIFSQPQILTGTIVNAFLVLAAFRLRGWKVLPLVFLPSLAAVLNNVVFGPFTFFLIYLLPAIWIGNFTLIFLFKELHLKRNMNYPVTAFFAAILKSAIIFSFAYLLFNFSIIPATLLTAMGIMQFITALLGSLVAFFAVYAYRLIRKN